MKSDRRWKPIADHSLFAVEIRFYSLVMRQSLETIVGASSYCVATSISLVLILLSPWAYGGVEEWFQAYQALLLTLGILAVTFAIFANWISATVRRTLLVTTPLLLLLVVASLQWAGSGLPSGQLASFHSIYPAATRLAFASLLAVLAGVVLGSTVFSKEPSFSGLLISCLMSASLVAFFGIAMRLTGDDRVIRGIQVFGDPFARFVNRNNAASFMLTGISAGIAILFTTTHNQAASDDRIAIICKRMRVDRTTLIIITLTLTSLCFGGILACRSRGGIVAAIATIFAGLILFPKRTKALTGWLLVTLMVAAIGLVTWLGLVNTTLERFVNLTATDDISNGRISHWLDAGRAFRARPYAGAGFGTYGYAYSPFSERSSELWYEHADNQFVELGVETGLAGVFALVLGLGLTVYGLLQGSPASGKNVLLSCLVSGLFVHSMFDYGIVIPAVAFPASVLWAGALSGLLEDRWNDGARAPTRSSKLILSLLGFALAGGLTWAAHEHRTAWLVDRGQFDAARLQVPQSLSARELDLRIQELSSALIARPDDAEGHRSLGQLLVYRYRSTVFEALRAAEPTLDEKTAWHATGLIPLHKAVSQLVSAGAVAGIEAMQRDQLTQRDLLPARRHYEQARVACKTLPGVHLPLNALRFTTFDPQDVMGTSELKEAVALFPTDTGVLRTAGKMAWQAQDTALAKRCWQAAFQLSTQGFGSTVQMVYEEAGPRVAIDLTLPEAGESALSLVSTPEVLDKEKLRSELASRLKVLAHALPASVLKQRLEASAAWLNGDIAMASRLFREAIASFPLEVSLRKDFAIFLWASDKEQAALEELSTAMLLEPGRDDLRRLFSTWEASLQRSNSQERSERL